MVYTKRPHMSLNWDQLETPVQAFYKKIDRRRKQLPFIIITDCLRFPD